MSETLTLLVPYGEAGRIAAALSSFWLGYLIILAVPGPNLLVVSYVAATHGLRSAVPLALAIACGAALLLTIIHALADIAGPGFRESLSFANVFLLLFSALRIIRAKAPCAPDGAPAPRRVIPDLLLGLACGFTNPVTAAYFTATLLGGNNLLFAPGMAAPLVFGTAALCGGYAIAAAVLFSHFGIRKHVMQQFTIIKIVTATLMAGYGIATAGKTFGPVFSGIIVHISPLAEAAVAAQL
jgi:threonine/homoserine/homoserine lactone efflux protein